MNHFCLGNSKFVNLFLCGQVRTHYTNCTHGMCLLALLLLARNLKPRRQYSEPASYLTRLLEN